MELIMKAVVALTLAAALGGCAVTPQSSTVYRDYQTQNEQIVRMGQVESVREVEIANPDTGTGTLAGAALGGIGGSGAGGGNGSAAIGILGAVAGGVLGNRLEASLNKRKGFEITVKLDNGELRAITQQADEMFRPGERVRLLSSAYGTRVTH
jgi:outer membrane lipoprotein SlyB